MSDLAVCRDIVQSVVGWCEKTLVLSEYLSTKQFSLNLQTRQLACKINLHKNFKYFNGNAKQEFYEIHKSSING